MGLTYGSSEDDIDYATIQPLVAFFPSHDGRCLLSTIQTVNKVSMLTHRPLLALTCNGLGQAVALNGMVQGFKFAATKAGLKRAINEKGVARALWIEDDIELSPETADEIAELILKADDNGWNIVAPYTTGFRDDGQLNWVYFKRPNAETGEIGRPFTEEEIMALKPYDELDGLAGLGFYYGDLYTDYVWYEGTYNGRDRFGLPSYSGIDWNYFLDNNIKLRHYPLVVVHEKPIRFSNVKILSNLGDKFPKPRAPAVPKKESTRVRPDTLFTSSQKTGEAAIPNNQ